MLVSFDVKMVGSRNGSWYLLAAMFIAAAVAGQLFLPPPIGLADNGDFSKVAGPSCLYPLENPQFDPSYNYFVPEYRYDRGRCYSPPFVSSEKLLTRIAVRIGRVFLGRDRFDLRFLGAIHASIYVTSAVLALLAVRYLGGWRGAPVAAAIAFLMTDAAYVTYFNSFYMDATAVAAVFGVVSAALLVCIRPPAALTTNVLLTLSLLFVTTKGQHAFAGLLIAVLLAWRSRAAPGRALRLHALGSAVLIAGAAAWMFTTLPEDYRSDPFFSMAFYEIAGKSATPMEDLRSLGLSEEHKPAIGMYAFQDKWPANDVPWKIRVLRQSGFRRLAWFFLTHPGRAVNIMFSGLRDYGKDIRPLLLANYRKQDGFPMGSKTPNWTMWTNLRSTFYSAYAPHVLWLYGAALGGGAWMCRRVTHRAVGVWVLFSVAFGLGELTISTLCDALETSRHLLLFHCATDVICCILLAWATTLLPQRE